MLLLGCRLPVLDMVLECYLCLCAQSWREFTSALPSGCIVRRESNSIELRQGHEWPWFNFVTLLKFTASKRTERVRG